MNLLEWLLNQKAPEANTFEQFEKVEDGGSGSGNHGHKGRPGEVGGSSSSGGKSANDAPSNSSRTPKELTTPKEEKSLSQNGYTYKDGAWYKKEHGCKLTITASPTGPDGDLRWNAYIHSSDNQVLLDGNQDFWTLGSALQKADSTLMQYLKNPEEFFSKKYRSIPRAISISSLYSLIVEKLMNNQTGGILTDLFLDNGMLYVITNNDGSLYKAPLSFGDNEESFAIGPSEKVIMTFPTSPNPDIPAAPLEAIPNSVVTPITTESGVPVEVSTVAISTVPQQLSRFQVRKVGKDYRWFAMPACTAVLNRVSAIDSTKLFDSFLKNAVTLGMPELRFFHEKLTLGKADYIDRDGYSYIASGTFNEDAISTRIAKALSESDEEWGLSIGYYPIKEPEALRMSKDIAIPVYEEGWNEEISILPEKEAASLFTNYLSKEVKMEQRVKDALKKLIPESDPMFEEIVSKVDGVNRSIEEKDMIRRSKEETKEEETPEISAETPVEQAESEKKDAPLSEEKTEALPEERKQRPPEDAQVTAEKEKEALPAKEEEDPLAALVKLLVSSDAFKLAVKTAVAETIPAKEVPTEETRSTEINDNFSSLTKAIETLNENHQALTEQISKLQTRMDEEDKEIKTRAFEWKADLPAKVVHVKSFRPSVDRIENRKERNIGELNERAQAVLDMMPKAVIKSSQS